jgi:hydrogenase/urease accessory protein HupE
MKKLWFKRKRYGWGWYPVSWQGWLVTALYAGIIIALGFTVDEASPVREQIFTFFLPFAVVTVALIRVCYAKGEKPRWQWGDKK